MRTRAALVSGFLFLTAICGQASATGFATYFASLAANGSTSLSSGLRDSERTGVGTYTVTFVRPITNCGFTVSVTGATPGFASAQRTSAREATISTFSKTGVAQNLPSTIILVCGP